MPIYSCVVILKRYECVKNGGACPLNEPMSLVMRIRSSRFPTRSDTNRAVQSQKMVRGLKLCIYEVEELY